MKILIVGCGVIGVTTAYMLAREGHQVTVVDRAPGPGTDTSFANGALLTPSMSEPWNTPGCWRVLLESLVRSDSPLQVRLRAVPSLVGWGTRFLLNSRPHLFERHSRSNLRLALYSLQVLAELREEAAISHGRTARGSLKLFRNAVAYEHAKISSRRTAEEGLTFTVLTPREVAELEPALAPIAGQLCGAIHYPPDETGDAYQFCVTLAERARQRGVMFLFGTEVLSLPARSGAITAARSSVGDLIADAYIIAAGSYSARLLSSAGVTVPVQPVKGYSVTFPCHGQEHSLGVPIIDDDLHAAIVPLQGAVRVAGTAEFIGFNREIDERRVQNLVALLQGVLPRERFNASEASPWCGLRAVSVDGVPVVGATARSNLFVNTGHGHLGWTMAAGSARLLSDLVCGRSLSLDPAPFAPFRFSNSQHFH